MLCERNCVHRQFDDLIMAAIINVFIGVIFSIIFAMSIVDKDSNGGNLDNLISRLRSFSYHHVVHKTNCPYSGFKHISNISMIVMFIRSLSCFPAQTQPCLMYCSSFAIQVSAQVLFSFRALVPSLFRCHSAVCRNL